MKANEVLPPRTIFQPRKTLLCIWCHCEAVWKCKRQEFVLCWYPERLFKLLKFQIWKCVYFFDFVYILQYAHAQIWPSLEVPPPPLEKSWIHHCASSSCPCILLLLFLLLHWNDPSIHTSLRDVCFLLFSRIPVFQTENFRILVFFDFFRNKSHLLVSQIAMHLVSLETSFKNVREENGDHFMLISWGPQTSGAPQRWPSGLSPSFEVFSPKPWGHIPYILAYKATSHIRWPPKLDPKSATWCPLTYVHFCTRM